MTGVFPTPAPLVGEVTANQPVAFDDTSAVHEQPEGAVVNGIVPVPAAKSGLADEDVRVALHAKGQSTVSNSNAS